MPHLWVRDLLTDEEPQFVSTVKKAIREHQRPDVVAKLRDLDDEMHYRAAVRYVDEERQFVERLCRLGVDPEVWSEAAT